MNRKEKLSESLREYRLKLDSLLDAIDIDELDEIVRTIITTFKNGNTLYVAGNGGSAATASHIQVDFAFFVRYFTKFRPKVKALTDNTPFITAIGNDNSYDDIFVEQLRGNLQEGDSLLAISASGNSANVVKAADFVNKNGGTSIGFVGFEGGKLKKTCKLVLHTPNPKGEYGPIEDLHMILDHFLVNYLVSDEEFLSLK
jgi:D-sedoheptulose 7-phosphate isomerase